MARRSNVKGKTMSAKDKTMDNFAKGEKFFKRDWILDAMEHGKMTREEAEHCWQQQEYREG